jgi:hypothetical protein
LPVGYRSVWLRMSTFEISVLLTATGSTSCA